MRIRNVFGCFLAAVMALSFLGSADALGNWNETDSSVIPFVDVQPSDGYYDSVVYVFEHGLMNGTSAETFAPQERSSRAMIAAVLWRLEGSPAVEGQTPFSDVAETDWYAKAAAWANAQNIYVGYEDGTFQGHAEINFEQLIAVLYRYAQAKGCDVAVSPAAEPEGIVSVWAKESAAWAMAAGVVRAEDGLENWTETAPRYQIAVLLHRFAEQYALFASALTEQTYVDANGQGLNYLLYTPANKKEGMPLIVYLHGGSAKGADLSLLTQGDGFPQYVKSGQLGDIPAYILMPQLPSNRKGWDEVNGVVRALVGDTVQTFQLDSRKISLTGHSMGGTGAWSLALSSPDLFSRVAPLSGSVKASPTAADLLSTVSVWAFVGSEDTIVEPSSSIRFVDALKANNQNAALTVFEGATHFDVPPAAYLDEKLALVDWLCYRE